MCVSRNVYYLFICRKGGERLKVKNLFVEAMNRDEESQEKFLKVFEEALGEEVLESTFEPLYLSLFGSHFTKETATEAVEGMYNTESKGECYTKAQTDEVAKKLGLTFNSYNDWDWYYTFNMVATDYDNILEPNSYAKVAKAWLEDIDAPSGKAFRYWWKVVKCK